MTCDAWYRGQETAADGQVSRLFESRTSIGQNAYDSLTLRKNNENEVNASSWWRFRR